MIAVDEKQDKKYAVLLPDRPAPHVDKGICLVSCDNGIILQRFTEPNRQQVEGWLAEHGLVQVPGDDPYVYETTRELMRKCLS